jgi:NAD(P)-dependent dehydrogenase (short-subunit alcohol dehydrogenase family)
MAKKSEALVVGVGAERGLGAATARRFAREGYHVYVAGRTLEKVTKVADAIRATNGSATPLEVDATGEADVIRAFDRAMADDADGAPADLIVHNVGNNMPGDFREMTADYFEMAWKLGCFAGFLVGREAARRLVPLGHGTMIFTGASASMRGRPRFAAFASAKMGLRAVAQSMAREFGPAGVHVAHVVIDGGIAGEKLLSRMPQRAEQVGPDGLLEIDAIAETYWHIHRQPRSAWTHEVDLRPFKESF